MRPRVGRREGRAPAGRRGVPPELEPAPTAGDRVRLPELAATLRRDRRRGRRRRSIAARSPSDLRGLAGSRRATSPATRRAGSSRCALRYRGVRGRRAAAADAGRRRARGARRCSSGSSRRSPNQVALRAARARGRARARARRRRRRATCSRPSTSRAARERRAPAPRSRAAARSTCARSTATAWPSRSSRASSAASARASSRRARASCCRTAAPASRVTGRVEPGAAPVPHDHPRDAAARRRAGSARSASWAASSRPRRTCSSSAALVDEGLDPQAALDRPRFRVEADAVCLEEGLWDRAQELERAGLPTCAWTPTRSASAAGRRSSSPDDALVGGSDPRKDGYVAAL